MEAQTNINISDINPNADNTNTRERIFWKKFIIGFLVIIPINCDLCGNQHITLNEHNTLSNPYTGRCTNKICRKAYFLRDKTFLGLFPKTNTSTI